jgi:hypothetical protein
MNSYSAYEFIFQTTEFIVNTMNSHLPPRPRIKMAAMLHRRVAFLAVHCKIAAAEQITMTLSADATRAPASDHDSGPRPQAVRARDFKSST